MMANGKESNDKLSSAVRPRLKREYQFALKAQSEICGESPGMGRTRSSRAPPTPPNKRSRVASLSLPKSKKGKVAVTVEAESDVEMKEGSGFKEETVEVTPEPLNSPPSSKASKGKPARRFTRSALREKDASAAANGNVCPAEMVKSEKTRTVVGVKLKPVKVVERKFAFRLKPLLETGLLEGAKVKYCRGSKAMAAAKVQYLKGVVTGTNILCFCKNCGGETVVSPTGFELHAGSLNKRPSEFIYLENGNSLRDIIDTWRTTTSDAMEETMRVKIGVARLRMSQFCLNCKGSMQTPGNLVVCGKCYTVDDPHESLPGTPCVVEKGNDENITALALPARVVKQNSSNVAVSWSARVVKQNSSSVKKPKKVTRKDLRLHRLVFEEDILPDGTEVAYYASGKKMLEGYKKGYGIVCSCCNTEISPSQFEAHAGCASRRKPYLHIFTSNGVSLHELSVSLCKNRKISTWENDDLCHVCCDGGSLICCDGCPRSFHKECLDIPFVPKEEFYCKYCLNAHNLSAQCSSNAKAAGRIDGVDFIEQITTRCIRIIKVPGAEFGGCSICSDPDFEKGFGPRTIILCDQCEKEYHVGCLKEKDMEDMKELPTGKWFCCSECSKIHSTLQKLTIQGEVNLSESNVDIIRRKSTDDSPINVTWRFMSGQRDPHDSQGLLSAAIDIFHEQFSPIVQNRDCDLIPAMVKGGTLMEHDFSNMYCAVLSVNEEIVSAGIIRVFGPNVAELPLVATVSHGQGKGYFNALFNCIEELLSSLNVKSLVLPAAAEAESIWTNKFGFNRITQDEVLEYRKCHDVMIFEGTSVLRKMVPKMPPVD